MSTNTSGRAQPRQLSKESIVQAAIELIAREGAQALTVRRLGIELGVDATAFYRHFPDKDALVLAIGDHFAGWVYERVQTLVAPETSWQDQIRAVARASWEAIELFSGAMALTFARTSGGEPERHMVELLLEIVEPLGFTPERTVIVYRMLADAFLALTGMNATFESLEPSLQEKDLSAWSRIYAVQSGKGYPAIRRHVKELISVEDKAIFDFTIETLIRGIAAMAEEAGK
jgi:AcrR family transcriptional regulator